MIFETMDAAISLAFDDGLKCPKTEICDIENRVCRTVWRYL